MKGKHGVIAERRREDEATQTELVALRRKNVQLLAEVKEVKHRLAEREKAHTREVRVLRAQRDADAAPKVAALEQQLRDALTKAQQATATTKGFRDRHHLMFERLQMHFLTEHGSTEVEAWEKATLYAMGSDRDLSEGNDLTALGNVRGRARRVADDDEKPKVRQIQRAQGARR